MYKTQTVTDGHTAVTTNEIDINYTNSYVAFLDVLGFKEMVFNNSAYDQNRLKTYYNIVTYFKNSVKIIPMKNKIKIMAVSDSIILSMPTDGDERDIENIKHFCIVIALMQQHLAKYNIWLRGAVTRGDVVHHPDDFFILGPAYIEAYLLEKKTAKFPRVILDNSLIDSLNFDTAQDLIDEINKRVNGGNWKGDILFNWHKAKKHNVVMNQDTSIFIDYLQKCFETGEDFEKLKLVLATNIKINIKQKLNNYEKYRWVTDYFISKFSTESFGDSDRNILDLLERL
jgi:hypothetical protein